MVSEKTKKNTETLVSRLEELWSECQTKYNRYDAEYVLRSHLFDLQVARVIRVDITGYQWVSIKCCLQKSRIEFVDCVMECATHYIKRYYFRDREEDEK